MSDLATFAEKLAHLGKDAGDGPFDSPRASVAAILRDLGVGVELFFIVRADREDDPWSGHVAFPGGRHETDDASLLATAIRETREEVGIDLTRADLLARLPDLPAYSRSKRGNLVVSPFVFALREDAEVRLDPNEVAGTLWVPFEKLARGDGKGLFAWTWDDKTMDLPCIRLEPDQRVLWGMTYRMLETLLEALAI